MDKVGSCAFYNSGEFSINCECLLTIKYLPILGKQEFHFEGLFLSCFYLLVMIRLKELLISFGRSMLYMNSKTLYSMSIKKYRWTRNTNESKKVNMTRLMDTSVSGLWSWEWILLSIANNGSNFSYCYSNRVFYQRSVLKLFELGLWTAWNWTME